MPDPGLDPLTESLVEYGIRYVIDGEEHTNRITTTSLINAYKAVVQQIRHHERHKVAADGYRIVRRTVTATPWSEID